MAYEWLQISTLNPFYLYNYVPIDDAGSKRLKVCCAA